MILFCARCFAPFLFTFILKARLANIVPRSRKCFDPSRNLTRSDVATNQYGLIVTFKCTKTIQFGERQLHIPLLRLPGSPICPVSAYQRMVRLVPALVLGPPYSFCLAIPVLQFLPKSALSPRFVEPFLLLVFLSLRPIEVIPFVLTSNHGIPGELIQIYGYWASDVYKAYLDFSVESKLAFTQQLRSAVLSGTS